jgi:hypothetical protein
MERTFHGGIAYNDSKEINMAKFLLWLILLVICWPVAILVLLLYPLVWLILLPFRIVGITIGAGLDLFKAIITFPARALRRG